MIHNPKFTYSPVPREVIDGVRHYATPDGLKLPSVTTILSDTKTEDKMKALNDWKKRMGKDKAQTITTEAANTGTSMHKMLEDYCYGTLKETGSNIIHQQARKMADQIIMRGLVNVDECWGVEVPLYYEGIYAGTTDFVGTWKGKPAIIDFKQTNKPKKKEWIEDYFMQLGSYASAHNKLHGTNIETGVILMCSRDCEYQEFVIEEDEFDFWNEKWWDRVEQYFLKRV